MKQTATSRMRAGQPRPSAHALRSGAASGSPLQAAAPDRSAGLVDAITHSPSVAAQRHRIHRNFGDAAQLATPDRKPATRPVVQRLPIRVGLTGLTHLVQEVEGSIFEGEEVVGPDGELEPGERLLVDDEDIIESRRGPNQEVRENRERDREGPQMHEWYHVLEYRNASVRDRALYIRRDMIQPVGLDEQDPDYQTGLQQSAGGALEKFRKACMAFAENETMDFDTFLVMLRKAGFKGDIHREQNELLVKHSEYRKSLITDLAQARTLALRPLLGDEAAIRDGILLHSLRDEEGCIAAQTRVLADKVALVNRLLEDNISLVQVQIDTDVCVVFRKYVKDRLQEWLAAASDKSSGKYVSLERMLDDFSTAMQTFQFMNQRVNSRLVSATLAKMSALVSQFIGAPNSPKAYEVLTAIVEESTTYRDVWTLLCPQLRTMVVQTDEDIQDLLDRLSQRQESAKRPVSMKLVQRAVDSLILGEIERRKRQAEGIEPDSEPATLKVQFGRDAFFELSLRQMNSGAWTFVCSFKGKTYRNALPRSGDALNLEQALALIWNQVNKLME